MTASTEDEQMAAYSQAVSSGLYARRSGLVGKYDNVRRYWEDEITRIRLRPHLRRTVDRVLASMRRVRVMDLGCGSADGYELLAGVRRRDADLHEVEISLLTPDILGVYKGVDLNADLLDQASVLHGDNPKVRFEQADFRQGLPLGPEEKPYDVYFSSYGTCSHHNDDETLVQLLAEVAQRTEDACLIVCDWLGRYSYEWQTLWTNDLTENRNMDYVVSYIYDKEERDRRRAELQHLTLRLVSRQEADSIVQQASRRAGVEIRVLDVFDRSIFTGRHMDTAEYNPYAQPLRGAVNSLHESNVRTDLGSLLVDFVPTPGFDFLNEHLEMLQTCWNTLVNYAAGLVEQYDVGQGDYDPAPPAVPATYPGPLRDMMERMRLVVKNVSWMDTGLPRENIVEPQLGYALRYLMQHLQEGRGCAHGLVAVLEVDKRNESAR
jgi:SAM-dependent methyltransferase